MNYSGSITIKKTELISLMVDEDIIFRSKISEDSKWFSFGRKSAFANILYDDGHTCYLHPPNWDYRLSGFSQFMDLITKEA
jgi:hypothetical protein